jgi:hypothetical protein
MFRCAYQAGLPHFPQEGDDKEGPWLVVQQPWRFSILTKVRKPWKPVGGVGWAVGPAAAWRRGEARLCQCWSVLTSVDVSTPLQAFGSLRSRMEGVGWAARPARGRGDQASLCQYLTVSLDQRRGLGALTSSHEPALSHGNGWGKWCGLWDQQRRSEGPWLGSIDG